MDRKLAGVVLALIICVFTANVASAIPFIVNGSDTPSAYTLTDPGGTVSQPVNAAPPASPWVLGPWMSPSADQAWPMNSNSGSLPGVYHYVTNFSLAGMDPSTATLSGTWATDDSGVLYLNGNQVSTNNGYSSSELTSFILTTGFTSGINILDFKVTNGPYASESGLNPTGLFVSFTEANAAPVPEPSTLLLLGAGILGVGILRKKIKG